MDVKFWLDLSGLDLRLRGVWVFMEGISWKADVMIEGVPYIGEGLTRLEAVGNLLVSEALCSKLDELPVREG